MTPRGKQQALLPVAPMLCACTHAAVHGLAWSLWKQAGHALHQSYLTVMYVVACMCLHIAWSIRSAHAVPNAVCEWHVTLRPPYLQVSE